MDVEKYNKHKESFKEYYRDLMKAIDVIQKKYSPGYDGCTKIEYFDFDAGVVNVQFERYPTCGCCGSDYDGAVLPMDVVTLEGFEKYIQERDELIKRYMKDEKARKKREAKQKEVTDEKVRRKKYEKLKAEFDD